MAVLMSGRGNYLRLRSEFEQRQIAKDLGGSFEKFGNWWKIPCTVEKVELIVKKFKDLEITDKAEKKIAEQVERERKLARLRKSAKSDCSVHLKVPGLKLPLHNYQKLGVMYALTNGSGVLIADEMGLGKASTLDSELLTPNGFVKMKDIRVGDFVIGSNGEAVRVTGVYPQGSKPIYRVVFSDGASLECCEEHLWQVNTAVRKNRGRQSFVKPLKEIVKLGLSRKNGKNGKRWNWYIPIVKPVELCSDYVMLDGYSLGCLLGDGGFTSHSVRISNIDEEIISGIEKKKLKGLLLKKLNGADYRLSGQKGKVNPLIQMLRELGVWGLRSEKKFVPSNYKCNSIDIRMAVLQGLMDTDGTVQKGRNGNSALFCTTSDRLKEDIIWICRSLGGVANVGNKKETFYVKSKKRIRGKGAWNVSIRLPFGMCPFRLKRKANEYNRYVRKYPPSRAIVDVKYVGIKPAQCISVDSEDGLYVANDFVVTHNTVQAIAIAVYKKYRGEISNCLIVTPAGLKWNWPIEIEKFTNEKYVVIDGTVEKREEQWFSDSFFYIVNYELLLEDLFGGRVFKEKSGDSPEKVAKKKAMMEKKRVHSQRLTLIAQREWGMVIIDEAHAIKSHTSKKANNVKDLKSEFRVALTGTPMDGRLEELHSVMGFVFPGLFVMSKARFIQKHAEMDWWGRIVKYKNIGEVRKTIRPFFLRRLKKDVLTDLPDKIYTNRFVVLSSKEVKIYQQLAERGHEITEDEEAMVAIVRCKQFCDCPSIIGLDCQSSKLEAFRQLIDEVVVRSGHKILVFSQYVQMTDILIEELKKLGLSCLYIHGGVSKKVRIEMQAQFNNDPKIDVMIGTDAMSQGLNFTAADYVVNYDDAWSPSVMKQREDRAHRIGQKNVVNVVNFVCHDTVEERIRDVLREKLEVTAQTLGDDVDEMFLKQLGPKEIVKIL